MARAGGSYIKQKDGSLKLADRAQEPVAEKTIKAVKPAETPEVSTNEDT